MRVYLFTLATVLLLLAVSSISRFELSWHKRLTNIRNPCPHSSADGSRNISQSNRTGRYEIFLMDIDGSGLKQITDGPGTNETPKFPPDGSRIVLAGHVDGNTVTCVINSDGTGGGRLTGPDVRQRTFDLHIEPRRPGICRTSVPDRDRRNGHAETDLGPQVIRAGLGECRRAHGLCISKRGKGRLRVRGCDLYRTKKMTGSLRSCRFSGYAGNHGVSMIHLIPVEARTSSSLEGVEVPCEL